ncbi:MAG: glycosyltransferase family 39 protein, partial [Microbacteriaceae bacterium]|nr:glycosyltransferase family 39 protein [Microbacteriaceae bacterium]
MHVAPQTQATPGARRRYRLAIAAAALLLFAVSLLWGLNLPHHEGPDELRHINSVARLADDRGWPLPYEAPMLASVRVAQAENGRPPIEGQSARPQVDPVDRSIFIGEVDASDRGLDNMVQHPPGYYAIAAFAVKAAEIAGLRWDQASIALRALSAALVAGSVPFIIGAVRWATGRRLIGVLGGVGVLAVPAFTVLGGYVSNDTLLVLACSATLYYLFRALRDPDAGEWVLPMAGLAYGLALFTKGIALMLGPTLAILVLIAAWRRSGSVLG